MSNQRFIDLETKVSHHDMSIEELQEIVGEQQKVIGLLLNDMKKLAGRFDAAKDDGPDIGPADEKPPHY